MAQPPSLAIPGRFGIPNASGQKFNKACDPCHISKTRCLPDPLSPTNSCKRCSKNGSSCVFSPIGPRRRPVRSKNDRIVELERRVRDMQLKLEKQVEKQVEKRANIGNDADREPSGTESFAEGSGSHTKPAPALFFVSGSGSSALLPVDESTQTTSQLPLPPASTAPKPDPSAAVDKSTAIDPKSSPGAVDAYQPAPSATVADVTGFETSRYGPDVVDRNIITLDQAEKIMAKFRQFIHGKFLGIGVPDGHTNQSLRRNKPAVWLSMLCAASVGSSEFLSLAPVLAAEMENLLDAQVEVDMEPDLDILQSLTIFYLFHHDLTQSVREKIFRCLRTSVAVVVRLGQESKIHNIPEGMPIAENDVTQRDLDLSRQLLQWHWSSFSLAVKARENLLIRPLNLISTSLRIMETSGSQCDMALVEWSKLIQITVEACLSLFSGHTEGADGLSDEQRENIIRSFERKRKQWLINCPFDLVNEFLMLEYHETALLISEFIYPAGRANFQNRSHGLPSLSCPSLSPASPETTLDTMPDQDVLAPYRIQYTKKCITAAHACLALVVSPPVSPGVSSTSSLGDPETLRYFSNVPYSRLFYALRFLLFVAHNIWRTAKYNLISVDSLKLGYYIGGLKRAFSIASDGGKFRPPSLWLYAIETRIEPWWKAFCTKLNRDRPPTRSRSSGEIEASSASSTPAAAQAPRQTSEPLPQSEYRTSDPALQENQAQITLPYDLFSPNQAMDFLIPFNFIQQAPAVAATDAIPHNPNIGPLGFARSPKTARSVGQTEPLSQASAAPLSNAPNSTESAEQTVDYDLEGAYNQGNSISEINDYLGTMDLDAFDFDWGDYSALFPGAEAFLPDPPVLPSPYPHTGEAPGDGTGEHGTKG
ncbi:hypothetical protein N8I77_012297 [Diaporthe amygdali]|uniref:Zn(2)-C6 fungal-type domain-containing protein n=1 Tax=Phomopsis amygdali TaxID=1214568 RepID=A0AAD9S2D7_PHOAM|nr:hypothetical protein N8I77_012297 [Diaporthe amygdali]KAK2597516.1 hypothetical protein N8I77_012297 [Diaporthe amygdali]